MQIPIDQQLDIEEPAQVDNSNGLTIYEKEDVQSPVSGEVAADRAKKAHFGLGKQSPGLEALELSIASGQENIARVNASASVDAAKKLHNTEALLKAATEGIPVSDETLISLVNSKPSYPDTVFELEFAKEYANLVRTHSLARHGNESLYAQAEAVNPRAMSATELAFADIIAGKQIIYKHLQDMRAENEKRGWFSWGYYLVKQAIPGVSNVNISPDWDPAKIFAPGTVNMENEIRTYWGLPSNAERDKWLKKRLFDMRENNWFANPLDAEQYLKNLIGMSRNEQVILNLTGGLDLQSGASIGVGLAKAAIVKSGLTSLFRHSMAALDEDGFFKMDNVYAGFGDLRTAGNMKAAKNVLNTADPLGAGTELKAQVPLLIKPEAVISTNPGQLARDAAEKMTYMMKKNASVLTQLATQPHRAIRVPEEVMQGPLKDITSDMIRREFPSINDAVIETQLRYEPFSNTFHAEVIIGKNDGTLFRNHQEATNFGVRELNLDYRQFIVRESSEVDLSSNRSTWSSPFMWGHNSRNMSIEEITRAGEVDFKKFKHEVTPFGEGYYISLTKPVDETSQLGRELLIQTNNINPISGKSSFLDWYKGADSLLGDMQRGNRHVTGELAQVMFEALEDVGKSITGLRKASKEALQRVLIRNRDYINYDTGVRGRAYRSQDELEVAWHRDNGYYPSRNESLAYWTYHQMMDTDWVMRNAGVHRDLSRQGVEMQYATFKHAETGDLTEIKFPGKYVPEMPWHDKGDPGILVLERNAAPVFSWKSEVGDNLKTSIDQMLAGGGYRLVQIANPADRPLRESTGVKSTINFAVVPADASRSSPLPLNLVDYNPGVHVIYPQNYFVKQPMIETGEGGRLLNFGDRTIFGYHTLDEANRGAAALDELRRMMLAKTPDNVMSDFISRNLPEDLAYWKNKFDQTKPNSLSLDHPIVRTFTNKTIFESNEELKSRYKDVVHERDTDYNLFRSIDMDFLANRDGPLMTMTNKGTPERPVYELQRAPVLDPGASLVRTLGNSVGTLLNNDTKIGAIEQWVQQYSKVLKDKDRAERNPYAAFYRPDFEENTAARDVLNSAKATRARIMGFVGTRSDLGRDLDRVQHYIMNKLGEPGTGGRNIADPRRYGYDAKWYAEHEMRLLKDPIAFTRSAMFDINFGFGNVAQFPIQAAGLSGVIGLAGPKAGGAGFMAYMLQNKGLHLAGPEVQAWYGKLASYFGWKPEHFLESYRLQRELGVDIVGKQHALREGNFEPEMAKTGAGTFLEAGRYFFKAGESVPKISAWHAAYYEFRQKFPDKELTKQDIGSIKARASDLAFNMTRASHSRLQEGWASVATMYLTFSQRLMELMWSGGLGQKGTRPTLEQRRNLFITHSALWGIPVGLGTTVPWPFYESMRQYALENGYTGVWDTHLGRLAMDGAMSYGIWLATGKDWNIPQRYGSGAPDYFAKALGYRGEMSVMDLFLGAPGNTLESAFKALYPATIGIYSYMKNRSQYPVSFDILWPIAKEIKSVNNLDNARMVANAGRFMSKHGVNWMDKGLTQADAAAIMAGLTPKPVIDARLMKSSVKDRQRFEDMIAGHAHKEMSLALKFVAQQDSARAQQHFDKAAFIMEAYGGFDTEAVWKAWRKFYDKNVSEVDKATEMFNKSGTAEQQEMRRRFRIDK